MIPAKTMRVPISLPSAMRWRRARSESVSLARSADGGNSSGEVEEAVVVSDVGVHVPEAGEERFAGGVDDLNGIRSRGVLSRSDVLDPIINDVDVLVRNDLSRFSVVEACVLEYNSLASRMVGKFGGEVGGAGLFHLVLGGQQGWGYRFPAFGNNRAPVVDGGEELSGAVQPEIGGREFESGGGVKGDAFFVSGGFDFEFGDVLDAGLAFG